VASTTESCIWPPHSTALLSIKIKLLRQDISGDKKAKAARLSLRRCRCDYHPGVLCTSPGYKIGCPTVTSYMPVYWCLWVSPSNEINSTYRAVQAYHGMSLPGLLFLCLNCIWDFLHVSIEMSSGQAKSHASLWICCNLREIVLYKYFLTQELSGIVG